MLLNSAVPPQFAQQVLVVENGPLPLIKMHDFGMVKDKFEDSAPHSQIGTALFTAPEVFLNVQGHAYEGEAVDVWSCGVVSAFQLAWAGRCLFSCDLNTFFVLASACKVLYMLLYGRHPFLSEADSLLSQAEQVLVRIPADAAHVGLQGGSSHGMVAAKGPRGG